MVHPRMALLLLFSDGPPSLLHHQLTPETIFSVSDLWRWLLVFMWVAVTFVIFVIVIVAYMFRVLRGSCARHHRVQCHLQRRCY